MVFLETQLESLRSPNDTGVLRDTSKVLQCAKVNQDAHFMKGVQTGGI